MPPETLNSEPDHFFYVRTLLCERKSVTVVPSPSTVQSPLPFFLFLRSVSRMPSRIHSIFFLSPFLHSFLRSLENSCFFFFIPLGNKVYEGFGTFSGILFNDNFTQFFYRKLKTRSLNFISRVFHFFSLQFLQSGILFLFFSR